ncbi:MAG: general secretion pathway protein GspK [Verrucomicrobiae bacterium]|nr:general secretion pathway protein GspK [Verrucomicrobiae bacterium]
MRLPANALRPAPGGERGSALVITLWVAFGLVALALYFAQSTTLELRGSDNRAAMQEADQAIEGAARYAVYLLSNLQQPGVLPELVTYQHEAVPVGDATFWFLGRQDSQGGLSGLSAATPTQPWFALVDEASKLNLNTATQEMLEQLPGMTSQFAAAIVDWRDEDDEVTTGGAEDQAYLLRRPAYHCKNADFESIDELRLVANATPQLLYGEDLNRNGVLDPNENDGETSSPMDNRDGRLDPGLLEYVTVHSQEPTTTTNGTARVNLGQAGFNQQLASVLETQLGADRSNAILGRLGGPTTTFNSVLEFFSRSGMTVDEFALIEADVYATQGTNAPRGLVNVNTASQAVLTCIPGVGTENAATLVGYRQTHSNRRNTVAWVAEVLGEQAIAQAGPYLTGRSYQFTADVAAVGHFGRGYRRTRFVLDLTNGTPQIVYRQDLSHLGWALGRQVREQQQQLTMNLR